MNYSLIYTNLIKRGVERTLDSDIYTEKHHIVPSCLGGSDDKSNLVKLTPEEHYLAHQLLVKIYPKNDSLIFAAHAMTFDSNNKRINNKLYGWLRRKLVIAARVRASGKSPSEETRRKLSEAMKKHVRSKEHCENISKSKMGDKNPMKNGTHTKEAKLKIGKAALNNKYACKKEII